MAGSDFAQESSEVQSSTYELTTRMYVDNTEPELPESDSQGLLSGNSVSERHPLRKRVSTRRAYYIRALALLCAMSLSIGSHYASHMLGPLKSRLSHELGTDNTEFSLLISALSLNSTWTPLLGGIIASKLGTTYTSILATGVIFLGQVLLLIGDISQDVRLMALGIFVFGIATSPLSVVQETIIVRFFKSHGLGVSLAIGLVAGKGASFVSAATSYPLTRSFGTRAPFVVATLLTGFSVAINLVYVSAAKWLAEGAGAELEASELQKESRSTLYNVSEAQALAKVAEKHRVYFRDITHLGDVFWAYLGLNVLCGTMWAPFTHLSSNIIEHRYGLTELDATTQASYLLAGSVILYPVCGYLVDRLKNRPIVFQLLMVSSCLTLSCYIWLALPPQWTQTAIPAIATFGTGIGFGTLLLVVIVPQIVPLKFVPTALGAHKSVESAGNTLFQTLAGWLLDAKLKKLPSRVAPESPSRFNSSVQYLLNTFVVMNILQFLAIAGLHWLDRRQKLFAARRKYGLLSSQDPSQQAGTLEPPTPRPTEEDEGWGEDATPHNSDIDVPPLSPSEQESLWVHSPAGGKWTRHSFERRVRRGEIFALLCGGLIVGTWVLFLVTAVLRLRSKGDRGNAT